MKSFNLTRINRLSPYRVELGDNELVFKTDYDILYSDWFEEQPVPGIKAKAYWLNLTNYSQKSSPGDIKIRQAEYYTCTEMVKDGDEENYIALIVKRDHPLLQEIIEMYNEEIAMFRANKPE